MNIGYASLAIGLDKSNLRTIRRANVTEDNLINIIEHNLRSLLVIIDYNIENKIKLFRISSGLIPFGSSAINKLEWWDYFKDDFAKIGKKIKENNIRVSMHPGQYTIINSPIKTVVDNSIKDLIYHSRILELLKTDNTSKIVLHIGGVYKDKESSLQSFIENFKLLPENVQKRMVIENDDRSYNISDVLNVSKEIKIPVIFDNLHHKINPPEEYKTDKEWIEICNKTFKEEDGVQKIHYSQQDIERKIGAHSKSIDPDLFLEWYETIGSENIDIMFEVKDKNISVLNVRNYIEKNKKII